MEPLTNKELSKLYRLKKEVQMQRIRICELETLSKYSSTTITGMPRTQEISDKVGKYASQIADLKCLLDLNLKKCLSELTRLTEYIQSVDDSLVRQIMTYRYIYGFTWQKTSFSIGGNNTTDSLKNRLYRYLKK